FSSVRALPCTVTRVCNPCEMPGYRKGRFAPGPASSARVKNPCHDAVRRTLKPSNHQPQTTPSRRPAHFAQDQDARPAPSIRERSPLMAISLLDFANQTQSPMRKGIVQEITNESVFLRNLRFVAVDGFAYTYNRQK